MAHGWFRTSWLVSAAVLSLAGVLHAQPVISLPLQSGFSTEGTPTASNGNAITTGTAESTFVLFINGTFNPSLFNHLTWTDPRTGTTTFTTSSASIFLSSGQIYLDIPQSLYSALVSSPLTVSVTVFEGTGSGVPSNSAPFILNPPPSPLPQNLPDAIVGVPYSQPLVQGGTPPFQNDAGTPPGLFIDSGGNLVGTPSSTGTYTFIVPLSDSWDNFINPTYTLRVLPFPNPTILPPLVPSSAGVGTANLQLIVSGRNFVSTATVYWTPLNGQPIPLGTTFISSSQLIATVPGNLLQTPGTVVVTVSQAPESDGSPVPLVSNGVNFSVNAPSISLLTPGSAVAGGPGFTLVVTGADFVRNSNPPSSVVVLDGTPLTTTVQNPTTLTVQVPASSIQNPGSIRVQVMNPGGTLSNAVVFPITQPPTLTALNPNRAVAQGPAFTLNAFGTNLANGMTILWNGVALPNTTLASQNVLSVLVPATLINLPGTATVAVRTADGFTTNSLPFTILPRLSIVTPALPRAVVGVAYSTQVVAQGGTPALTWSATGLPGGLGINSATGEITGTATAAGTSNVTVRVVDSQGIAAQAQYQLLVVAKLTITTASLPAGALTIVYPTTRLAATGGVTPYVWSASGLPAGLSLNSATGDITGTPTAPGNFTVTISVSDNSQQTASVQLPLSIGGRLAVTSTSLGSGTTGNNYSNRLTATGGLQPYSWTASGLPSALVLNPATGDITGIPAAAGNFTVAVTVKDNSGQTASAQLPLSITLGVPPLQIVTAPPLPQGTTGITYGVTFGASGGSPDYTFSQLSGTLPPGLSLVNGTLAGTPTQPGTFRFSIQVTDSLGGTASRDYTLIVVAPPLVITNGTLADLPAGTAVNIKFVATGGVPPYVFGASGILPSGTTFANTGTLSGTAGAQGTFTFTVSVTDSAPTPTTTTKTFTVKVIQAPLTISPTTLGNGQVGVPYSAQLSAVGGTSPFTFTATGAPAGISVSNSGAVSGTPTIDGTFTLSVTLTDANGLKVTQGIGLTITVLPLTITNTSLPNGVLNADYTANLTATGGVAPYTFTATGLPDGLSIAASGAITGVPTATGSFTVVAKVVDTKGITTSKSFPVTIAAAPLVITTGTLPGAVAGTAYSAKFAATGGVGPFTWSGSGLPGGLGIAADGTLSGTPSTPGSPSFTVTVTDSAGTVASKTFSLTVALPTTPPLNLNGLPTTSNPTSQPRLGITIGNTYPVDVVVILTMTFAADNGPDDPAVQFSSGGRTAQIIIPAGSTAGANDIGVQTGTVAGTITITARLQAATQDITPTPVPTRTIRIAPGPPVITSVTATRSSTGFTVVVTGFATSREVTQAAFTFNAAAGGNLQTTQLTVPVGTVFAGFYASAGAAAFGSQFTFTQTFNVSGSAQIASVTVTLSNAVGNSSPASANLQ